jgi:N6-L-threonylcarbamoyladenine synthase
MNILGIETSCDETAAAVVKDGNTVLSSVVSSQIDLHREFGGIVPEVAARSHLEVILPIIQKSLKEAFDDTRLKQESKTKSHSEKVQDTKYMIQNTFIDLLTQIDGIAVTYGPGLPGALLVGVLTARTLALTLNKPLLAVDHVHAHAYAAWLGVQKSVPRFPCLALIVSGNHTQLVLFKDHFDYKLLGQTLDDAAGEAFDKVARLIGLAYPGGPSIAKAAENGNTNKYKFPKVHTAGLYDFSFSGLKTAALRHAQKLAQKDYSFPSFKLAPLLTEQQINDTAASFQNAAVDYLVSKTTKAVNEHQPKSIILAGGVAANQLLRERLQRQFGKNLFIPPVELCTDNAAMVAGLGFQYFKAGKLTNPLNLETDPSLSM